MDQALSDLIKISRAVGQDWQLVQGGGGNTSVKTADGQRMYIKASGTALKDMDGARGWRRLRLGEVLAVLTEKGLGQMEAQRREAVVGVRLQAACDDETGGEARPSVESHFHALLGRCVIHLHPVAVGAFVNAKEGQERLERLFAGEGVRCLWAPYADPGLTLATKLARLVERYERAEGCKPAVVFLGKHGLVVSAEREGMAQGEPVGDLRVWGRPLEPVEVAGSEIPSMIDELPVLAVAAAAASGSSVFHGVGELRHKESDRLAGIVSLLGSLGGAAEIRGEDLIVHGTGGLQGGIVDPLGDHRLVMAAVVASFAASERIVVRSAEWMDVSFPGFIETLEGLG